jgi:hypothetical protein
MGRHGQLDSELGNPNDYKAEGDRTLFPCSQYLPAQSKAWKPLRHRPTAPSLVIRMIPTVLA